MATLRREDLIAFLSRPWAQARARKYEYWGQVRARRGPTATLRAAEDLWLHMRAVRGIGPRRPKGMQT
jgi:hypothetical protein